MRPRLSRRVHRSWSFGPGGFGWSGSSTGSPSAAVRDRLGSLGGDVEFECSKVTFIDSSGLHLLIAIRDACAAGGGSLVLVNPSRCLARLVALTGLDAVLADPRRRFVAVVTDAEGESVARPIYSIGAVAAMLGVETATLRAWEERYGVVVPTRSGGGQRIYSRDDLERLRFVVDKVNAGSTPADAHRLLADQLRDTAGLSRPDPQGVTIVILLAERDRYAAELFEYFLRTEGYDVCSAFDPTIAEDLFTQRRP